MSGVWRRREWIRGMAGGVAALAGCRGRGRWWRWSGLAFSTEVSIAFEPPKAAGAPGLSARCAAEVKRLESIFSLSDETSAVRRLNREGRLEAPPPELVSALELCRELHRQTEGAFDVTVQPLWELYEAHFRDSPGDGNGPPEEALRQARERVDFRSMQFGPERVQFERPGMAVTLNGMIQGFVTDRVADLLLEAGVTRALIDLGEYRAIGSSPEGTAWNIGVRGPSGGTAGVVPLENRALAISSGAGWVFDQAGRFHHLFHPAGGSVRSREEVLAVAAPGAAWADGLATAGLLMSPGSFKRLVERLPWPVQFWRFGEGAIRTGVEFPVSSSLPPSGLLSLTSSLPSRILRA